MSLIANGAGEQPTGFYNNVATQSLRFDDGSSAYLTRTPSSAGNRKTWTWSGWIKLGVVTIDRTLFGAGTNGDNQTIFNLGDTDVFVFSNEISNTRFIISSDAKFRDPSAWYHVVLAVDTTQGTDTNRVKLYVNGELQTLSSVLNGFPNQNVDTFVNAANANTIGYSSWASQYYNDGYMAEVNFVDGTQYAASDFGETKNGVWIAKQPSVTYGTNGFRLQFNQTGVGTASSSTIGADTSGNTNHWTSSGIVASDCAMPDSPENNFATWNNLRKSESASTFSEGNLKAVIPVSSANSICATMGVSSGKYYWEVQRVAERPTLGVGDSTDVASVSGFPTDGNEFGYFADGGNKYPGNSSYGASYANGDIIGFALDMDAGTVVAYKNNSSQGTLATGLTDTIFPFVYNGTASLTVIGNFGQDSSFAGTKTAQGNTDGNGKGDFYYAPPSGFLALCTSNLPEPTIGPNSATQADDHFDTVLRTGTGSEATVSLGFKPDFLWTKTRSNAVNHNIASSSLTYNYSFLQPNTTNAENTSASTYYMIPTSTGYTVGTGDNINQNTYTFVDWLWKANGGSTSSNTDGSITSTVQANTDAGFSIVTYTGTGSSGATYGHGLTQAPQIVLTKERNNTRRWVFVTRGVGITDYQGRYLDDTLAFNDQSYNISNMSSTLITLGADQTNDSSSSTYVAYCFHPVEGYSKFGSYTGGGTTFPFIYLGFRPAWVMFKRTDTTSNWAIFDSTRDPINAGGRELFANEPNAEQSNSADWDFVSNGIKFRRNYTDNSSGGTFIYMAFAENPFKYANAR